MSQAKNKEANNKTGDKSFVDIKLIKSLIDLMVENDLSRIELREGESHILLRRGRPPVAPTPALPPSGPAAHPAPSPPTAPTDNEVYIRSPMVGTFYASPDPESPPLVSVGSVVQPDTVVCLIEAMKVFNELKAEISGRITKVLVNNAQAVEFDQPLFAVKPS